MNVNYDGEYKDENKQQQKDKKYPSCSAAKSYPTLLWPHGL